MSCVLLSPLSLCPTLGEFSEGSRNRTQGSTARSAASPAGRGSLRCHPEDPRLFQELCRVPSFPSRVQAAPPEARTRRAAPSRAPVSPRKRSCNSSWVVAQGAAPAAVGALQSPECPQVKQSTGCPEPSPPGARADWVRQCRRTHGPSELPSKPTGPLNTLRGEPMQQQVETRGPGGPETSLGRLPSPTSSRQPWPACVGRGGPAPEETPASLSGVPPVK